MIHAVTMTAAYVTSNREVVAALVGLQLRSARDQTDRSLSSGRAEAVPAVEERCACGRVLHYPDSSVRAFVESVIRERGPNVIATIDDRAVAIPRHYIALHGLDDVDPDRLGFPVVDPPIRSTRS